MDSGGRQLLEKGADLADGGAELQKRVRELFADFTKSDVHVDAYSTLNRACYWEAGKYSLTLRVDTARPDRQYESYWGFELSEDEIQRLRLNVVTALQDTCGQRVSVYNFAYPAYQEHA